MICGTHPPALVVRPRSASEESRARRVTLEPAPLSGLLDTGAAALGASDSSRTSCRRSPSSVNKRRSVTVKPDSCLFSAIAYVLLWVVLEFRGVSSLLLQQRFLRLPHGNDLQRQLSHSCFAPAIMTSRPGVPTSRRMYPNATLRSPEGKRRRATLVISPTSFSPETILASAVMSAEPSSTKPVNLRCTLPRERMRSTISCPT